MTPASQKKPISLAAHYERLSFGQLLHVPNFLTLCRLFLIPVFLGLPRKRQFTPSLYVFGIAALTDSLDGTLARWFNWRTELGAILDPFADKLLLVSAFVALTMDNVMPGWLLGVIIIRDVVIVLLLVVFAWAGLRPRARRRLRLSMARPRANSASRSNTRKSTSIRMPESLACWRAGSMSSTVRCVKSARCIRPVNSVSPSSLAPRAARPMSWARRASASMIRSSTAS